MLINREYARCLGRSGRELRQVAECPAETVFAAPCGSPVVGWPAAIGLDLPVGSSSQGADMGHKPAGSGGSFSIA